MSYTVKNRISDLKQEIQKFQTSNPFANYNFLNALEKTDCLNESSGWKAQYLLGKNESFIPFYEKNNSQGEFVFDYAWANAYYRYGMPYYPKIVMSVPFTPVEGKRIFSQNKKDAIDSLKSLTEHARKKDFSSIHALYVEEDEKNVYEEMRNVALFAFSTSSSAATIPVTLKTVSDDLGVKKDVASFVVPVGATINMDGTAIMQGLATMFIASTVGVDLSLTQYGQIILLAMVTSIGTAAVPSAGTVTLALILGSVGLPLDAIGLILAVDRILDMIRTSVNVCGDAAVSCIVAKSENELDENMFNK